MKTNPPSYSPGLKDVIGAQTALSSIDGQKGVLAYRGINIHELAERATYEEVVFLLWYGRLPRREELAAFKKELAENRGLPIPLIEMLRSTPPEATPMVVLRNAVSQLTYFDPEGGDISVDASRRRAIRLTAQMGTILAAYDRIRRGVNPIDPDPGLDHAANILYMFRGQPPDPDFAHALDTYLVLLADHGMNASTFTARVVASTKADLYSAITAALAALKGPLHGGANEETMKMLLEIGSPDRVDEYIDRAFAAKKRIMGFGHRIYRTGDPRSVHLNTMARELGEKIGDLRWYEMSLRVQAAVLRNREIYPNVDFFSAPAIYYLGIPIDLFTPMFAVSRVAGWCAHVMEQYEANILIRPESEYIGPTDQHYVSMEERGA